MSVSRSGPDSSERFPNGQLEAAGCGRIQRFDAPANTYERIARMDATAALGPALATGALSAGSGLECNIADSARNLYDELAGQYNLMFEDCEAFIPRQDAALGPILNANWAQPTW
jgi:hypothetical protein